MALTADVKDELARIEVTKSSVRVAELSTILRFSGGLHLISGRIAIEVELDTAQLARRVRKDLAELSASKAIWRSFHLVASAAPAATRCGL